MDFIALNFATFTQFYPILHPKFFVSLEILNTAPQINLAANYGLRFLNFDFGAIFKTLTAIFDFLGTSVA